MNFTLTDVVQNMVEDRLDSLSFTVVAYEPMGPRSHQFTAPFDPAKAGVEEGDVVSDEAALAYCQSYLDENFLAFNSKSKPASMTDEQKKALWIDQIDTLVADVISKFTRFQIGYEYREKAAGEYRDSGYEAEPSIWITAFADNAGMPYKESADLILAQAANLRSGIEQLEAQRMRKYAMKNAQTIEEADAVFNDIVSKVTVIAGSLK